MRIPLVAMLVSAVGLAWLAHGLRPDAFFAGDSGLKLVAAMNALSHPARPFDIDLPRVAGEAVPAVGPMMPVHGDHAHVLQSPVFPVLTAPLVALLGLRGAYVLPALSFLGMLPLLEHVRRRTVPDASPMVLAGIGVAASPLLFYALELWEHAPAVALLALCLSLGLRACDEENRRLALAAGMAGGAAAILRPEAVWAVLGLLLVSRPRTGLAIAAGAAIPFVPWGLGNLVHFGSPLPPHVASTLAPLSSGWAAARLERIDTWVAPGSAWEGAGLLLVALAWALRLGGADAGYSQAAGLCGAAVVALLAAGGGLSRDSLWQMIPVALFVLVPTSRGRGAGRRLSIIAAVTVGGIVLTATHSGGAQWGPRFLLVATPPLLLMAAAAAARLTRPGRLRLLRTLLVGTVLVAAVATSRAAYRELRGTKQIYGRVVDAAADAVPKGGIVVTNVWWFDQVVAVLGRERTFLVAETVAEAAGLLRTLSAARVNAATLVWTGEPDGEPLSGALSGTCFALTNTRHLDERRLTLARAVCR